jgi:hypothetical protein
LENGSLRHLKIKGVEGKVVEISNNYSPVETFKHFVQLLENHNGESSWMLLSNDSQEQLNMMAALIGGFAQSFTEGIIEAFDADSDSKPGTFPSISDGKTFWVTIITEGKEEGNPASKLKDCSVVSESISEDTAIIIIRDKAGKEDKVDLIREDGIWKINMAATQAES